MPNLKKALLCLVLATQLPAQNWSRADTLAEGAFLALLTTDYMQTRDLLRKPKSEMREMNPLLGSFPSQAEVNQYFLMMALTHVSVAVLLPPDGMRRTWQGLGIALELGVVAHNVKVGLRVRW